MPLLMPTLGMPLGHRTCPSAQYYGYYANRPYTFVDFLTNAVIYMFWFDSWFYWTHRVRVPPAHHAACIGAAGR